MPPSGASQNKSNLYNFKPTLTLTTLTNWRKEVFQKVIVNLLPTNYRQLERYIATHLVQCVMGGFADQAEISTKSNSIRNSQLNTLFGLTLHLIKKFPFFYGTWRFITFFTRARHWPVESGHPTTLMLHLISFSYLHVFLPRFTSHARVPTKILYAFLISPCQLHTPPISLCLI